MFNIYITKPTLLTAQIPCHGQHRRRHPSTPTIMHVSSATVLTSVSAGVSVGHLFILSLLYCDFTKVSLFLYHSFFHHTQLLAHYTLV